MGLEPGPAAFFNLADFDLTLEPPLEPADSQVELPGLDAITSDMDAILPALGTSLNDLNLQTFSNTLDDSVFANELRPDVFSVPTAIDNAIADGVAAGDADLKAAVAAIPQISDPPAPIKTFNVGNTSKGQTEIRNLPP